MAKGIQCRSAAYYVHVTDRRTVAQLDEQEVFEVPKVGDYIIYNETPNYLAKYEGPRNRGVGTVKSILGCNVYITKITENGNMFSTSIMIKDLRAGLYRFVQLRKLPDRLVADEELDIYNLPQDLKELVVLWPTSKKCSVRPS